MTSPADRAASDRDASLPSDRPCATAEKLRDDLNQSPVDNASFREVNAKAANKLVDAGILPQCCITSNDSIESASNKHDSKFRDLGNGTTQETRYNGVQLDRNSDGELSHIRYNNDREASAFTYDANHNLTGFQIKEKDGSTHSYTSKDGILTIDAGTDHERKVAGELSADDKGNLFVTENGGDKSNYKKLEFKWCGSEVESNQFGVTRVQDWGGSISKYSYDASGKLNGVDDWGRHVRLNAQGVWTNADGSPSHEKPVLDADGAMTYYKSDGTYLHHTPGGTPSRGRYDGAPPDSGPTPPGDDTPPPVEPPDKPPGTTGGATDLRGGHVLFGAWTDPHDWNKRLYPDALPDFENQIGRDVGLAHRYIPWGDLPDTNSIQKMADRGTQTMLSVGWHGDTKDIAAGKDDQYWKDFANKLKSVDGTVTLRYGWEMDGSWSQDWVHSPKDYVAAYQHIHDIFDQMGVKNVKWSWCPTSAAFSKGTADDYYPGDKYVDWIGGDGYSREDTGYKSFAQIFQPMVDWAAQNHPDKPLMIGETGVSAKPGDQNFKAQWFSDTMDYIKAHPSIQSFVYFDVDQMNDPIGTERAGNFSIDSSTDALAAFKRLANDPWFAAKEY
ncbi:MAG: hypothetical protein JST89_04060 [Cyanobacteria bacterium SZAS-4]|nr:hypothetical protein [Cyanobacteria bacterium SZAS-4]